MQVSFWKRPACAPGLVMWLEGSGPPPVHCQCQTDSVAGEQSASSAVDVVACFSTRAFIAAGCWLPRLLPRCTARTSRLQTNRLSGTPRGGAPCWRSSTSRESRSFRLHPHWHGCLSEVSQPGVRKQIGLAGPLQLRLPTKQNHSKVQQRMESSED